ncbi:MAG: galactokinase [Ignavibacteriales bacterium]|nr:galactokinase [Ignavibacteriales bacterium]
MDYKQQFPRLYGTKDITLARQAQRWERLLAEFRKRFGDEEAHLFSVPGRTEIGGNHTDHNHGKVLAASIDLDSKAVAALSVENTITIYSEQYPQPFIVEVESLLPRDAERGTTAALIRGIASKYKELGYRIGGFHVCVTSDVPIGSGLSSSASIEVLIATILNSLFNNNTIYPTRIAQLCQYAENTYFGKPSGLMDQITCAVGGIVKIDFNDPQSPLVEKIEFDFARAGYNVLVVDTGGSHADLTEEYASIPREMKSVAAYFGKEFCREISERELLSNEARIRSTIGDRPFLRAMHFIKENERVDLQVKALLSQDFPAFLRLIQESGNSSFRWL